MKQVFCVLDLIEDRDSCNLTRVELKEKTGMTAYWADIGPSGCISLVNLKKNMPENYHTNILVNYSNPVV